MSNDLPKSNWQHRTLTLPIGEGKYAFRTLSFLDVWTLWPVLAEAGKALRAHKPIAFSSHLAEALEHLCPGISKGKDYEALTSTHLDALAEFFVAQDWSRIQALGDRVGDAETRADPVSAEDARRNFFALCLAGAQSANMDVIHFVEQRFEFCADAIMVMRDALQKARAERGVLTGDQFFSVMSAVLPTIKAGEDEKPAFIREIEEKTAKLKEN